MATVNFSVPDKVKRLFSAAFSGRNKSRVIADLMMRAVEEQRRQKRRAKAINALLVLRRKTPAVNGARIHALRQKGRP